MFPIKDYEARFREILEAMDTICAQANGDFMDDLEDLNAEFEDALFMLSEIDAGNADSDEEIRDALEEMAALLGDYRRLSAHFDALSEPCDRLDRLIQMAGNNL